MPFQLHTILYIRSFNYRNIINGGLSFRQFTFFTDFQRDFCENFTVIDQEIIWYGNIHLQGREKVEDNIMRVKDKKIADELLELAFK